MNVAIQEEMGGEEVKAVIPESVLKKRKRNEEWALAKNAEIEACKKQAREKRKVIFKQAEKFAADYEEQVCHLVLNCHCSCFVFVQIFSFIFLPGKSRSCAILASDDVFFRKRSLFA